MLGALIQVVGSSVSIVGLNAQKWAMEVEEKLSPEQQRKPTPDRRRGAAG